MSELRKPTSQADLPVPFNRIGEDGWADATRRILRDYGVPLPTPVAQRDLDAAQQRLAVALPEGYRSMMTEIGALDLGVFRFLPLDEVEWLNNHPLRQRFSAGDAARLTGLLGIADFDGDPIALDASSGECALCCHDLAGIQQPLRSVDALVQYGFISLPVGYYGWEDDLVEELVETTLRERFGDVL